MLSIHQHISEFHDSIIFSQLFRRLYSLPTLTVSHIKPVLPFILSNLMIANCFRFHLLARYHILLYSHHHITQHSKSTWILRIDIDSDGFVSAKSDSDVELTQLMYDDGPSYIVHGI